MRVGFPKNSNVLVQKYGLSSGVFPFRSRTAELQVTEYSVCESGTSSRSIFIVRKYGRTSMLKARVFPNYKNMIESFDFALSLLLTHVVYMKTNIIMCDRQWFT